MADQNSVHIGHDDMLQLVHDVGGIVDAQRQTEAKHAIEPPSKIQPKVRPKRVYVSCDGIMYCTNEREPCPSAPQKNRLLWRQMRVGCVYWQDEKEGWQKQVIWGQEDLPTFTASLFQLAFEHGYRKAEGQIFIADGGEWCWGIHDKYFAEASGIFDWYHAPEHVRDSGKILHSTDDEKKSWVDETLELLRNKGGEGLLQWLQPQRTGATWQKAESNELTAGIFCT